MFVDDLYLQSAFMTHSKTYNFPTKILQKQIAVLDQMSKYPIWGSQPILTTSLKSFDFHAFVVHSLAIRPILDRVRVVSEYAVRVWTFRVQ